MSVPAYVNLAGLSEPLIADGRRVDCAAAYTVQRSVWHPSLHAGRTTAL